MITTNSQSDVIIFVLLICFLFSALPPQIPPRDSPGKSAPRRPYGLAFRASEGLAGTGDCTLPGLVLGRGWLRGASEPGTDTDGDTVRERAAARGN